MIAAPDLCSIDVLLVEDNPGDARLTREALKDAKMYTRLNVVTDGAFAMDYLNQQRPCTLAHSPDLILLDLNLPGKNGWEVLSEIRQDAQLRTNPVVILTTSQAEDVLKAYSLHAHCTISKPVNFEQFIGVVKAIEAFWFTMVKLPLP